MQGDEREATRRPRGEAGFALIAVLAVLAVIAVVAVEFSHAMRLEAVAVRTFKETTIAAHLAQAAIAQASREIVAEFAYVGLDDEGEVVFYGSNSEPLPRLDRKTVPLGPGHFSYRLTDEQARVNLNGADRQVLDRLMLELGVERPQRDVILDSIEDWRDPNEEHRLNGAESEDTYLKQAVPYRSRNRDLTSTFELLQIKGVTPALFKGGNGKPGLADLVTTKILARQVNINTAPPIVLSAFGLSAAEISEIEQARREQLYTNIRSRFGGRGFVDTTRTFRIEAQGLVDGRTMAGFTAILQKRSGLTVAVLEWIPSAAL